MKAHDEMEV